MPERLEVLNTESSMHLLLIGHQYLDDIGSGKIEGEFQRFLKELDHERAVPLSHFAGVQTLGKWPERPERFVARHNAPLTCPCFRRLAAARRPLTQDISFVADVA
eukprot:4051904-Amphidinium_carterae.1